MKLTRRAAIAALLGGAVAPKFPRRPAPGDGSLFNPVADIARQWQRSYIDGSLLAMQREYNAVRSELAEVVATSRRLKIGSTITIKRPERWI
jgi:hypothetical protein